MDAFMYVSICFIVIAGALIYEGLQRRNAKKLRTSEQQQTTFEKLATNLMEDEDFEPDEFNKFDSPDIKVSYHTEPKNYPPKKKKKRKN